MSRIAAALLLVVQQSPSPFAPFAATSIMVRGLSTVGQPLSKRFDYEPPPWAAGKFQNLPTHGRLHLANLPTPLYQLTPVVGRGISSSSGVGILQRLKEEYGITMFIKRDDMSGGVETGGNKIRKLEFLLAEALAQEMEAVVTIGGEQSNHCRATAAASRMLGLDPHLILRTKRADAIYQAEQDYHQQTKSEDSFASIGTTGNLLFDRMVGSTIYTCTPGEYGRVGSTKLVETLCAHLEEKYADGDGDGDGDESEAKNKIYPIPVGGSNGLGTWGYLDGVEELLEQWHSILGGNEDTEQSTASPPSMDHVIFACGSGGTATGICLGMGLAYQDNNLERPEVHAIGVCDSPDYFYEHVATIADEMGLLLDDSYASTEDFIRQHLTAHQGKGLGYAASSPEELEFVTQFALETGIVLDPVYSGKALYHFVTHTLEDRPEDFRNSNILFWHTGGALGLFDKTSSLFDKLQDIAPAKRLDVYGKGLQGGIDLS